MPEVMTLSDVDLDGRTVLLRVDINSPLHPGTGAFLDDMRLREVIPTLQRLGRAKVILLSHQSRPGKGDFTSLAGHATALGRLLRRPVKFVDGLMEHRVVHEIGQLQPGEVLMCENVRFYSEETVVKGDSKKLQQTRLVQVLAEHADVFVNDAFACAHRGSASIVGFTHLMPNVAGDLMGREISALSRALHEPVRPCIAVLGGIKVDDSVAVARNMLANGVADEVWFTGGAASLFLAVSGREPGAASTAVLVRELGEAYAATFEEARQLWATYQDQVRLPLDVALSVDGRRDDVPVESLPSEHPIFDLGLRSIQRLSQAIHQAGTIILNGPAGVFEQEVFAFGTVEILEACAASEGFAVMGGGHTAALVAQRGLAGKMGHVSTGGGACLDYLAGRPMPGIASLVDSRAEFAHRLDELGLSS